VCRYFSPAVLKHTSAVPIRLVFLKKNLSQQLALTLRLRWAMANLYLVKGTKKKEQNNPRRGRDSSALAPSGVRPDKSTERRYRYPAEEIWQVSEESWQVAERTRT
jgi:hypothetical protein